MSALGGRSFPTLLNRSATEHGHLCPGQIIGVRMAMLGLKLIGLENPAELDQLKKLIVFVEMDRCAADAIQTVTLCRLGRRSLKYRDYGIMAATFVNLATGEAVRVVAREDSREAAARMFPDISQSHARELRAYPFMSDAQLFNVYQVEVPLAPTMMPGPTRSKAVCTQCGIVVRDGCEVFREKKALCRPCAGDGYFKGVTEIDLREGVEVDEESAAG